MLIVTRRVGEKIKVGHEITVELVSVNGRQARIGIEAPRSFAVNRQEVYRKKRAGPAVDNTRGVGNV